MMEYYQNRLPKAAILCDEASENHFLLTINKKWKGLYFVMLSVAKHLPLLYEIPPPQ
jgi:hypothetical protein